MRSSMSWETAIGRFYTRSTRDWCGMIGSTLQGRFELGLAEKYGYAFAEVLARAVAVSAGFGRAGDVTVLRSD